VIPIENIYYLYCYAWNRFEEAQSIQLGAGKSPDLPNLLGRVLLHGTRMLLRRGLDRNYRDCMDEIATVRGRIELGASLRLRARSMRRLVCEFDELSHDLLHNQIIKASPHSACPTSRTSGLSAPLLRESSSTVTTPITI
jgi:5-methylcytosine-specific restriction enzyme subunit McrC